MIPPRYSLSILQPARIVMTIFRAMNVKDAQAALGKVGTVRVVIVVSRRAILDRIPPATVDHK